MVRNRVLEGEREMRPNGIEQFERKFAKAGDSECWLWRGYRDKAGYGIFSFRGRNVGAHRAAWGFYRGEIGDRKLHVCHKCDNPPCVNPDHLFVGTHKDNMADMIAKGRARHPSHSRGGEQSGRSKLTNELVRQILASRDGVREIARRLGVSHSTVSRVRSGQSWGRLGA